MPENWRLGPGTLKERWLALGWGVLWSDESRSYEVFDSAKPEWGKAKCRTVDEVEAWVAANSPPSMPSLIT